MAPTGFLALHAWELLSRHFTVIGYSDGVAEDDYTRRFESAATLWRRTGGLPDQDLADQIRRDEIDVLFDLQGHAGARLLVFARKPAPVQITWLGYVGTTGLGAMDYLLADRFHVRDKEEGWYSEAVLRMPHSYICFSPLPSSPEVSRLPALDGDRFTFGCFNSPAKYSQRMIEAWAQILVRVPKSRLLLKYYALADEGTQKWLREQFSKLGVDDDRILIEGPSPQPAILASYGRVDLALDTQPYSGGLTTCEALWMGVPVITCPGRTFAGRHATSHLINAGYEQFVAADLPAYVELAIQWAQRIDELAETRTTMRQQVQRSPLCDAQSFTADFSAVIKDAWAAKAHSA
jgi:predicted O-linked N-acetylglucosamine transferase (SPINDLY family)